jgi:CHAT domain-containing protein/tetratricopeptide (TPR) repeat protein
MAEDADSPNRLGRKPMSQTLLLAALLVVPNESDWFIPWLDKVEALCGICGPDEAKRALKLLEKMEKQPEAEKDVEARVYIQYRRGCCQMYLEDFTSAKATFEAAIKQFQPEIKRLDSSLKKPARRLLLFNLYRDLGECCMLLGRIGEAGKHLRSARALAKASEGGFSIRKQIIPRRPEVMIRLELLEAGCRLGLGETQAARETFEKLAGQIAALREKFPKQGQLNEKQAKALQAWDYMSLECQGGLVDVDIRESRTVEALQRLRRILRRARTLPGSRSLWMQFGARLGLAGIYQRLARFDDAQLQLNEAKALLERLTNPRSEAKLLGAQVSLDLERINFSFTPEGGKGVLKALAGVRKRAAAVLAATSWPDEFKASKEFEIAQVHELRGRVFAFQNAADESGREFSNAADHYGESIRLLKRLDTRLDHDFLLQVRRGQVRVRLRLGKDLASARKEAGELLELFAKTRVKTDVGRGDFLQLLVEAEEKAGNLEAAAAHAEELRKLSADQLASYLVHLTAAEQLGFFRRWDDPGLHASLRLGVADKKLHERSAEWLLNGKAKIAEVMAQIIRLQRGGKDFQAFQRCIQRQAYLLYGGHDVAGGTLKRELLEEEAKKRNLAENRAPRLTARWYKLEELRAKLSPDEVYVDVFSLSPKENAPRAYYAWVVPSRGDVRVVRLGEVEKIHKLVKEFASDMGTFDSLSEIYGRTELEETLKKECLTPLSKLLLDPVLEVAGKSKRWVISPDGPLWGLPWGALLIRDGKQEKYAVEEFTFRYLVSGRDLLRKEKSEAKTGEPWVLANPAFQYDSQGGWRLRRKKAETTGDEVKRAEGWAIPLEGAQAEGDAVAASLFKGKGNLQKRESTKEGLLTLTAPPRIVYIATHGFGPEILSQLRPKNLRVDDPLLSCGLAFAGFNRLPSEKSDEGSLPGLMTGAEVLMVPLHGTDLVVLSACQSGTGVTEYGQSPADLRHAFHLAGARSVVSTLWSVEDFATRDLMRDFMKAVAQDGAADKAAALTEAQRRLMKSKWGKLPRRHPFFWAAFTLSGS